GVDARAIVGKATYTSKIDSFTWEHGWVEYADQIIDCNVDSMSENPKVPDSIRPKNFWGTTNKIPNDRKSRPAQTIDADWIQSSMENPLVTDVSRDLVKQLKELLENPN